jgi:hypothetical protein
MSRNRGMNAPTKAVKKNSATKKTGTAPDPILKLIDNANRNLYEFHGASEEEAAIREKIGEHNCRRSRFSLPSRFDFAHGYSYTAAYQFDDQIKRIAKQAKENIEESRRLLKKKGISPAAAQGARDSITYWTRDVQERKEAKEWLENAARRDQVRLNKLWRTTGYGIARRRLLATKTFATNAVNAVLEAKPTTFEGSVALIKFVADRVLYSARKGLPLADMDAEICAPLYRAHDLVHLFGHLLPEPSVALAAVRADLKRREAARREKAA